MAILIKTEDYKPESVPPTLRRWVYNGWDCMVPLEVHAAIEPEHTENSRLVYLFERAMRAPAFDMQLRGIKILQSKRAELIQSLRSKAERSHKHLNRLANEVWEKPLNPRSPLQMTQFFYHELGMKPIYRQRKGRDKSLSCDEKALEKISQYFYAQPLVSAVLDIRSLEGKIEVLERGIDPDGRYRAGFNPSATETGRWSSSKNIHNRGGNIQNITEEMREVFVADDGMKLAYLDLSSAESFVVAYVSQDPAYIEACLSGNLHAAVSKMIWPEADPYSNFYRHFTHRDLAKRGGHASNYVGAAKSISDNLHIPFPVAEEFQRDYFTRFPGIRRWHQDVQNELQTSAMLTTPLGRTRQFFGRRYDESTLKEAVAFVPQSTVADVLNLGLYRVFMQLPELGLLAQIHDAVLLQFPESRRDLVEKARDLLTIEVPIHGRTMKIPVDVKEGYDWKNMSAWNSDQARSQVRPVDVPILERVQ